MAVKIRLRQQGRANRQTYRLIAIDSRVKRDGKYLENLGWYDPYQEENNALIKEERTLHWLNLGAEMSESAKSLIARIAPNVIKQWTEKENTKKIKAAANKKARRNKKSATKAK